jgi:phosphoglycolate phosphatase-like HAD superfamily hydrolase
MLSVVIFDCDGVLFDSADANIAYYNAVLERLGRPPLDAEWSRRAHFLSSHQLYEAMFGAESALSAEARRVGREVDYGPYFKLMRPTAELSHVLLTLRARYRLAMATNRSSTVPGVMREFGLDRFFELAVGSHDVARPKPHPDMLHKCLDHFGVEPAAALYVGDSESDHHAAQAAGMHFLAVGEIAPGAHRIGALRELPEWLATAQPSMIMPPSTAIT